MALLAGAMVAGVAWAGDRPREGRGGREKDRGGDRAAKMFSRLDANGDGKITRDEMGEKARMVDHADKDGDGAVSIDEFRRFLKERQKRQHERREGDGRDEGRPGRDKHRDRPEGRRGRGEGPPGRTPPLMAALDTDRDGRLSRDEIARAPKVLERFDRNQDGFLDARELHQAMGGPGGRGGRPDGRRPPRGGGGRGRMEYIKRMDRDRDGRVTRDEFMGAVEGQFKGMDRDGDGAITEKDLDAMAAQRRGRRGEQAGRGREGGPSPEEQKKRRAVFMKHMDANGDGRVSLDEFRTPRERQFKSLDRDGDGAITGAELEQAGDGEKGRRRERGERGERGRRREQRRDKRAGRGGEGRGGGVPHWFEIMDKNKDGKVSRDEFVGPEERFKSRDTNGDGSITAAEAGAGGKPRNDKRRDEGRRGGRGDARRRQPPPADEPPVDF